MGKQWRTDVIRDIGNLSSVRPAVSDPLGVVITDAVKRFAGNQGWDDDHYDVWYHGSQLWILRDPVPYVKDSGPTTIHTVQVLAVWKETGGELVAIPETYEIDPKTGVRLREILEYAEQPFKFSAPIAELELGLHRPGLKEEQLAIERIDRLIRDAWATAESLQLASLGS